MDTFVKRKRPPPEEVTGAVAARADNDDDDEPTDVKLALLASLFPAADSSDLLEALLVCDGSVDAATTQLKSTTIESQAKRRRTGSTVQGYQSSMTSFQPPTSSTSPQKPTTGHVSPKKAPTKKGKTLHLYSPEDVAAHTPCSIIHNFLPAAQANALLTELLAEAPTFHRETFRLFDNVVSSPHTFCFYVHDRAAQRAQETEYVYNGSFVNDVRQTLPNMRAVSAPVQAAVNAEIAARIHSHYPHARKLRFQCPRPWAPNTAFVNCYDGARESVGWHSDHLTYLGPRAVIGSLSLGVAREFRVRRVVPRQTAFDAADAAARRANDARADVEGQIAIHLPHNSLLVMHAEMQEEWKHSIAPAAAIDPHPLAGNKRINITYRWYRESFHPRYTPKCKCNVPTVLRCVQRKAESRGRYMWMCYAGYDPQRTEGCGFFEWAVFDEDGEPPWAWDKKGEEDLGGGSGAEEKDVDNTAATATDGEQ